MLSPDDHRDTRTFSDCKRAALSSSSSSQASLILNVVIRVLYRNLATSLGRGIEDTSWRLLVTLLCWSYISPSPAQYNTVTSLPHHKVLGGSTLPRLQPGLDRKLKHFVCNIPTPPPFTPVNTLRYLCHLECRFYI